MTNIRYKNTFTDMLWFSAYTYSRSPVILIAFGGPAILVFYSSFTSMPASTGVGIRILAAITACVMILSVLLAAVALLVVLSLISKANRTILTQHSITLTELALIEETEFNRTEQKWTGVPRLGRTRRHIFVYVSQNAAHVIPRRAFADANAWNAFYEELRSRVGSDQ